MDIAPLRKIFPARAHDLINQVQGLHTNLDLPGLCRVVSDLQKIRHHPAVLIPLYEIICSVANQTRQYTHATEFALRIMSLGKGDVLTSATALLERASLQYGELGGDDQLEITRHFHKYLRGAGNFAKLQDLSVDLQASWAIIFTLIFPKQYLSEQIILIENTFVGSDSRKRKAGAAITYISLARRIFSIERKPIKIAKLRSMAEYVFANEPEAVIDPERCSEEYFDDLIASLARFDLFDLVDQAMQIRDPEPNLAIHLYVGLLKILQQDLKVAYVEDLKLEGQIRSASMSDVLRAEFSLLSTRIARDYMESIKRPHAEFELGFEPSNYFERAFLAPLSDCPQLVAGIVALRRSVLVEFGKAVSRPNYFVTEASAKNVLGVKLLRANIVQLPGSTKLEVYVFNEQETACAKAYFILKLNVKGEVCGIEPQLYLEGVKPRDRQNIILFWEYITLALLAGSRLYEDTDGEVEESDLDLLAGEIYEFSKKIALKENFAAFQTIEEGFVEEEKYREKEVDLNNCYRLARMIFESFIEQVTPATYALSEQDFLADIFTSITFIDPKDLEKVSDDVTIRQILADHENVEAAKFPFIVVLKDKAGSDIIIQVKSADEINVLGSRGERINALLQKYILELVFGASAKRLARTKTGAGQGAIIFDETEEAAGPEQVLRNVYQREFLKLVDQKGIFAFPWLYTESAGRDDVLFYPFENQDVAAKRNLFEERDGREIFVQIEPFGSIRVLPVSRRKGKGGGWIFRPKDRTTLRERQKELLADSSPFPAFYRLYIKTTFSNEEGNESVQIITPYALREDEDEIWSDDVLGRLEAEIAQGEHKADPIKLLKGTSGERRRKLEARIQSGELTIVEQTTEIFEINTTYHRPKMVSLAELLEQGCELER